MTEIPAEALEAAAVEIADWSGCSMDDARDEAANVLTVAVPHLERAVGPVSDDRKALIERVALQLAYMPHDAQQWVPFAETILVGSGILPPSERRSM